MGYLRKKKERGVIIFTEQAFNSLYGILITKAIENNNNIISFNSLYGIPNNNIPKRILFLNFQFPLWDTMVH